jgi:ribose-phosphate pyrophosphokinase
MTEGGPVVLSTQSYAYLQAEICQSGPLEVGKVERRTFPDGEQYLRILTDVAGRDTMLVGGTITEADTLELYDLACGLVHEGVRSLTLAIPFFGYATMERVAKAGEVVTAKTRARLLSSIPVPGSGSRVLLLDLHSEGIPFYFEGAVRPVHLRATPLILDAAKQLAGGAAFVLACTDAGRAKWVEALANQLGVTAAFVFKRRLSGRSTEVLAVSAQVHDAHVIIYDDMIRTGGSLLEAAKAYRAAGAARVSTIATHGLFCDDALAGLRDSGLFSAIVCTNSHPRALSLGDGFVRVVSVAPLFAAAMSPSAR